MFPDATALTIAHLSALLEVPVVETAPDPRPDRLVRVMWTGSQRVSDTVRDTSVTVECWAPTSALAHQLGELVHDALCALDTPAGFVPDGEDGWIGGPYTSADPDTGTPQCVMTVRVRTYNLLEGS